MNLYVVGKVQSAEEYQVWDLQAIFDTEADALSLCADRYLWFIGPVELNNPFPENKQHWPGAYYPYDTIEEEE